MHEGQSPREGLAAAKTALRDQVLAARRRLTLPELGEHAGASAERLLATDEVRRAATVAAYVSVGREPGTSLPDGLSQTYRWIAGELKSPQTRRT